MDRNKIIILSAIGGIVLIALLWYLLDPFGSSNKELKTVTSIEVPVADTAQIADPIKEQPKKEKIIKPIKRKNNTLLTTVKNEECMCEIDYYEVQEGDNLKSISNDLYGNTKYWFEIFALNEEDIDDWNFISVGKKLMVPRIN